VRKDWKQGRDVLHAAARPPHTPFYPCHGPDPRPSAICGPFEAPLLTTHLGPQQAPRPARCALNPECDSTLAAHYLDAAPEATAGASPCALSKDARRDASAAEAAEDDSERGGDGTGLPAGVQPNTFSGWPKMGDTQICPQACSSARLLGGLQVQSRVGMENPASVTAERRAQRGARDAAAPSSKAALLPALACRR
jgi:hypothetical protein